MKRILTFAALLVVGAALTSLAQSSSSSGQKSLAATMNVYAFPNAGQSASTQSQDEGACYQWAVQNTGTDPFQLAKQSQASAQQAQQTSASTQGAGVRGAARGAAAGALIGGMAGDAGTGAAVGAATGAVVHRSRARRADAAAQQQNAQTQEATSQQMNNFKKAFGVCMESKKYMVKY